MSQESGGNKKQSSCLKPYRLQSFFANAKLPGEQLISNIKHGRWKETDGTTERTVLKHIVQTGMSI